MGLSRGRLAHFEHYTSTRFFNDFESYTTQTKPRLSHSNRSSSFLLQNITLECGSNDLFGFFNTFFATTEFAAGIKRCFQRTCTGFKVGGIGFEEFHEEFIQGDLLVD